MIQLELRRLVDRLTTIESIALIPRVASTNLVARRIVAECIENELSLPQAMIIACGRDSSFSMHSATMRRATRFVEATRGISAIDSIVVSRSTRRRSSS